MKTIMPKDKTQQPKAFGWDDDRDNDVLKQLTKVISAQLEWLKANAGAATKQDLADAEKRILKAIGGPVTPGIEAAARRTQVALDRLDAQIPDA